MIEKIRYIQVILGFVSFVYCLFNSDTFDVPIWLLPLVYTLGMLLCIHNFVKLTPGILTINILMFFRYVYTPFAYYQSGFINEMLNDFSHLDDALFLMLYELVFIFATLEYTGYKYKFRYNIFEQRYIPKISYLNIKKNILKVVLALVILVYIAVVYKSLGQGLNVFFSGSLDEMRDIEDLMESGQGYINIIWQCLTVWLYYYFVMRLKRVYDMNHSFIPVLFIILLTMAFILLTFVDATGITRWYTLVSAGACFACLSTLFPIYRKRITLAILIPVFALILFSSLVKNGGYERGEDVSSEVLNGTFGATNIDVYCNGIGNVNVVFRFINASKEVGIECLPYDILRSMPIVCHYLPKGKDSSSIFHQAFGRNDQIIPCISQSLIYFGLILSPLLSCIIVVILRRLDFKFYFDFSFKKYVYAFSAIWIGAITMSLNLSLLFMWLYIRLIPFYLTLAYTEKFTDKTSLYKAK